LSQNDDVEIERAEVLAQINHGSFKGEPWSIIARVLKANPDQGNALLLAGSAAFSEEHYSEALKYWQHVQKFVPPNSPDNAALTDAIAKAQERLGVKPLAQSASKGMDAAKSQLIGRVEISPTLATKIHPGDTVFIYAVPVSGSRMPLAMIKTTVAHMPYDFVLDDTNAMNLGSHKSCEHAMMRASLCF
jgi:cytochrome c-type biogenesis protein CcmH